MATAQQTWFAYQANRNKMRSGGANGGVFDPKLTVWLTGDSHAAQEESGFAYLSLETPMLQIDGESWDFGINVGDWWNDSIHTEVAGVEIARQYADGLSTHNRNDIYDIGGNHDGDDENHANGPNWLFKKYIDPMGDNTAFSGVANGQRPYAVDGTYNAYSINVGNILFIFLSDAQEGAADMGQKGLTGGTPDRWRLSGGIQLTTWQWLHDKVLKNSDKIIVVSFHQALFETTIGSGATEFSQYGDWADFSREESDYRGSFSYYANVFHNEEIAHFLAANEGNIHFWLSGHVHHRLGSTYLGRGDYINKYGIHNLNVANLTKNLQNVNSDEITSHSFFLDFDGVNVRRRAYMHSDKSVEFAAGFLPAFEQSYTINKAFIESYTPATPSTPSAQVTGEAIDSSVALKLTLSWNKGDATGVVIARKKAVPQTFIPVDETTYYRDEVGGNGAIVFIGTAESFQDYGVSAGTSYHYNIYTYNSGNDSIKYNTTNAVTIIGTTL